MKISGIQKRLLRAIIPLVFGFAIAQFGQLISVIGREAGGLNNCAIGLAAGVAAFCREVGGLVEGSVSKVPGVIPKSLHIPLAARGRRGIQPDRS